MRSSRRLSEAGSAGIALGPAVLGLHQCADAGDAALHIAAVRHRGADRLGRDAGDPDPDGGSGNPGAVGDRALPRPDSAARRTVARPRARPARARERHERAAAAGGAAGSTRRRFGRCARSSPARPRPACSMCRGRRRSCWCSRCFIRGSAWSASLSAGALLASGLAAGAEHGASPASRARKPWRPPTAGGRRWQLTRG